MTKNKTSLLFTFLLLLCPGFLAAGIDTPHLLPKAGNQNFSVAKHLVDPDADSVTLALYEILKLQFRHRVISGQTDGYFNELESIAGKTPLLRVGDFASYTEGYPYLWSGGGHILGKDPNGSSEKLIDWYRQSDGKAIISFQWHWHSPSGGEAGQNNFYTSNTSFDIRQAVIPGTPEYNDIIRDIDDVSAELAKFMYAGVPVLWRPLHEAGGTWFWWGAKGPEPCLALYNIMYDRMVSHNGLHNLIWVWSTPEETWYPGNNKVDIIGHDSYPGSYDYGNQKNAFDQLFDLTGGEKLIAMTENGPIPDPDASLDEGAPWLYFMSWNDLVSEQNSEVHISEVFRHNDVLTMESANFRTGTEWRSSLYPEGWKPGFSDSKGHFLHDFSHAGYHGGGHPLPHITNNIVDVSLPPYSADNSGLSDVSSIIQQALNDVGSSGGGVVYLPPGTYRISVASGKKQALMISHSNTVLRGAGADSTFLFNDQANMREKRIIYVAPAYASWFQSGGDITNLRHDLLLPTKVIPVESVSAYQVGDQVIVRSTPTSAFIAEHGMTGMWTTEGIKGLAFKRRIDSVDRELKLLILDTPTRYPLKTRDVARVYKAKTHLQECGVENLSVGNREILKDGWDEDDYSQAGTGAYDAHFAQALRFEYTENSWVKGVHTYRPDVNTLDVHLPSNCLQLNMCRHITVDSCDFQKPQYEGGGGNGYMYTLHSNDCLIQNSRANHSRHNYDFKYPFSNGNVIHNCRAENSKYASDFHMYLSMSNLFDCMILNGDYLESVFRPYGSPIHGHSSTQSVFYNTVGEQYHPNREYIIESRQYQNGYVIGTSGEAYEVKTDPLAGTQGGYDYDSSPRDFVEGIGEGSDLRPVSLYLDQLDRRMKDSSVLHTYQVEIVMKNLHTGDPVPGASVAIYGTTSVSDAEGKVSFPSVPESFFLEASHKLYYPLSLRQILIYSDTLLSFKIEENKYEVSFELLDEMSLDPFSGVSITLAGEVKGTDGDGKAVFSSYTGSSEYSFQKNNFKPVSGTLEVSKDTLMLFLLERSHADVKIRLREGNTPVNKVSVKFGEDSLLSDALGLAKFLNIPVNNDYSYSTSREEYVDKGGVFRLTTDTTINISMEKIPNAIQLKNKREIIHIWPNPTTGILHLELPIGKSHDIRVFDARGVKILETKESGHIDIDLAPFPAGIYTILASEGQRCLIVKH